MVFTQVIDVQAEGPDGITQHLAAWDAEQHGVAPGYLGYRVLADRDRPGSFTVMVDFGSEAEATANNARPETAAWSAKLGELVVGAPEFRNCDAIASSAR